MARVYLFHARAQPNLHAALLQHLFRIGLGFGKKVFRTAWPPSTSTIPTNEIQVGKCSVQCAMKSVPSTRHFRAGGASSDDPKFSAPLASSGRDLHIQNGDDPRAEASASCNEYSG